MCYVSFIVKIIVLFDNNYFILYNRCPTGVGKWASSFIQISLNDFNHQENNFYLDYMITSLAIILLPVQAREKFLEQVRNKYLY